MMSNLRVFGSTILGSSETLLTRSLEINEESEVRAFIETNKSANLLPKEVAIEHYKSSLDLVKYRQQLATRQLLQSVNITDTEEGEDQVVIHLSPEEKVRKILI
jgi:hypothetical protein